MLHQMGDYWSHLYFTDFNLLRGCLVCSMEFGGIGNSEGIGIKFVKVDHGLVGCNWMLEGWKKSGREKKDERKEEKK